MSTLVNIVTRSGDILRKNSTTILTALGVSGTITTAYLTAQASFKAAHVIAEGERIEAGPVETKDVVKAVWKFYIPAMVSGSLTVGCIIGASRVGAKKTAAAYSLLSVSEKAFSEYKDKVVEQIGEKKEQGIRDAIAQDKVNAQQAIVISGAGNVLCCELHTGRYFYSDMESLKKAQNEINAKLNREMAASLYDFYYIVGLEATTYSSDHGWTAGKLMDLQFSSVLGQDGRPCLAFEYNYLSPI